MATQTPLAITTRQIKEVHPHPLETQVRLEVGDLEVRELGEVEVHGLRRVLEEMVDCTTVGLYLQKVG